MFERNADVDYDVRILKSGHMTATVETESGSHYTVVTRPRIGTVLIKDSADWAVKGDEFIVTHDNRMILFRKGRLLTSTTRIKRIHILSN